MAQPPAYNREHDFDADEPDNTDGQAINDELDRASQSVNAIRANLAKIQRDDGGLANGIVTEDSLAPALKADLFNTFSQDVNDKVLEAQQAANDATNAALAAADSAASAANSRDIATDAAANAVAAAQAAGNSQTAAAASATSAANSATAAGNSATSAALSATAAHNDAQSAATSATTAQTAATDAQDARDEAQASATAAAASETNAANSETLARAWASQETGTVDGTPFLSAKQYAEQAAAGAGLPIVAESEIPTVDNGPIYVPQNGPMEFRPDADIYVPLIRYNDCRLGGGVAANSIKLSRYRGDALTVGDRTFVIPENGIEIVPTGVTGGTIYYVYAYDNAGALALEYSTTARATHIDGTQIKQGAPSRLLVGMFRPTTGGDILDGSGGRFVASWFNPRSKGVFNVNGGMATASTSPVSGLLAPGLLCWAGKPTRARFSGNGSNTINLGQSVVRPYLDGAPQETSFVLQPSTATQQMSFSFNAAAQPSTDKICNWALYVWVNSGQLSASAILNAEADI